MKKKVLFIEDDFALAEISKDILKDFQYDIDISGTGSEALTMIKTKDYDLLIIDYSLPDMTALDFIRKFKDDGIELIPFIIISGVGDESIVVDMMKSGALDYVVKNINYSKAISTIVENAFREIETKRKLKLAEAELRKQKEQFKMLFEYACDCVFIFDLNGHIVEINKNGADYLAIDKNEIIGQTFGDLFRFDNRSDFKEILLLIKDDNNFIKEGKVNLKNGQVPIEMKFRFIQFNGSESVLGILHDIHKRKDIENRYSEIVENQSEGIGIVDKNECFIFCNKQAEIIFGVKEGQLLGRCLFDFIDSDNKEKLQIQTNNRKEGLKNSYDLIIKRDDGQYRNILITATPKKSTDGEYTGALGIFRDITERVTADNKIRQLLKVIEQSSVSIVITDTDGKIEYVNPKFCENSGYENDELIGRNASILKSGKTKPYEYKLLWDTIKSGHNWVGEFSNKRKNGSFYWELATISPVFDSERNIINFVGIKEDITEKKENMDMIRLSEMRFRSVWESSFDGMRLTDKEGIVISVNNAFCSLVGKSKQEIVGNSYLSVYDFQMNQFDIQKYIDKFQQRKIASFYERELILWNGRHLWLELSNSFVQIEDDQTLLLSIFRDITDRKKTEKDLIDAKDKAEVMNKVKSNFLANMSHELRTPMIGILGFTEVLQELATNQEQKRFIDIIHNSGLRLLDTLNLILDLTKVEAGRLDIKFELLNVISLIEDSVSIFELNAHRKRLFFNKEILCDSVVMYIDQRMFLDIVNNLLNNAIKFTNKGGITLRIETIEEKSQNYMIVKIIDTGIGIPKAQQEIIWEAFRQGSEGLNRSFEGTGLGLTVAKKYCEKLGGRIFLDSNEKQGSVFTLKFPISDRKLTVDITASNIFAKSSISSFKEGSDSRVILVVDDDPVASELIDEYLSGFYTLEFAKTGKDALAKIETKKYRAILMDINLGKGLDGIEVTKEIRTKPNYKKTPIVAVTAFAMPDEKDEFLSKGCTHYLSKPFNRTAILDLMNSILPIAKSH